MRPSGRSADQMRDISMELNTELIGKELKVVIDRVEGEYYVARTEFDSPEVDCEVLIKSDKRNLRIGNYYIVKITDAMEYDLFASVV